MPRTQRAFLGVWITAFAVGTSAGNAAEPLGFTETRLESGVTVADIEPLQDGRLLMVLDHDGELRASFSSDQGQSWTRSVQLVAKPVGNSGSGMPAFGCALTLIGARRESSSI